jgi:hypothetical protein
MSNTFKVAYDSKTSLYAFKTTYDSTLEINGKPVSDPLLGWKSGQVFVTKEKPEIATFKTYANKLSHYRNKDTEEVMFVDEYDAAIKKINMTRVDDDGDWCYASIEDEVFAVRFMKTYAPVYEKEETVHRLEVEIINYPVSEYRNIVPLYSTSGDNIYETKCTYRPNNVDDFYSVCERYGIYRSRIDMPTHSGIRFAKIDDNYLTGAEDFERMYGGSYTESYENCVIRMNAGVDAIVAMVELYLAKSSRKMVAKETVGHLVSELVIIGHRLRDLNVKKSDESSLRQIQKKVSDLIAIHRKQ